MITRAAVKILNLHTNEEIVIPCHRHCDAFYILKVFNMRRNIDYKELAQGFLDEDGIFYTRVEAWKHAFCNGQLTSIPLNDKYQPTELYSEDLW